MIKRLAFSALFILTVTVAGISSYILLPMDAKTQKNHLKAYGITFWVINNGGEAYWLLNHRGGSFAFVHTPVFESECKIRGVSYEIISNAQFAGLRQEISNSEVNKETIKL